METGWLVPVLSTNYVSIGSCRRFNFNKKGGFPAGFFQAGNVAYGNWLTWMLILKPGNGLNE